MQKVLTTQLLFRAHTVFHPHSEYNYIQEQILSHGIRLKIRSHNAHISVGLQEHVYFKVKYSMFVAQVMLCSAVPL